MKIGSRVMCVVNLDMCGSQQIVNGSQGIVENMIEGVPVVRFKNGVVKFISIVFSQSFISILNRMRKFQF